ncbi:MAG TPA: two-component regulator propeller domain-containing protein [Puia sp.]|jgi:ligand-binding sensor domain-containing protein|nr:two-component regulator propeller domain-containing protein [Puia sp.]
MSGIRWILLLCSIGVQSAVAQEYSYTHYDIADGLASSMVYCITQDKEGFIWVGTEAGVCRFDGTHFSTFTSADGLPDAEVLQMFGDSKGRVWMAPFRGSVCYYYQGEIHHPGNDSLLAAIRLHDNSIENFAEDAKGNILIQEKTALHLIGPTGRVRTFDSAGGAPIDSSGGCSRSRSGYFHVQIRGKIYELSEKGLTSPTSIRIMDPLPNYTSLSPSWAVWRTGLATAKIRSFVDGRSMKIPFGFPIASHESYSIVKDSLLFDNQFSGAVEYDPQRERVIQRFLPGRRVSRTFRDRAGNLWFTTLGSGLFRLKSDEIRTIHFPEAGIGVSSVHSIALNATKDRLLVGDNHCVIYPLSLPDLRFTRTGPLDYYGETRIMYIHDLGGNKCLAGTDAFLLRGVIGGRMRTRADIWGGVKAACELDDHRVLVGGASGAVIFDLSVMRLTDTLWRTRVTTVYGKNDTNYIGTLQGLWRITGKDPAQFMGTGVPFLRNRIQALTESSEGILWIASYDAGIIGYTGGRVVARISQIDGLIGNVCHCLYLHDGILWVGTDKGLNRIELNEPGYPVTCFSSDDGLASNVVNVIYAIDSTMYVGTAAGLSYFDETKIHSGDECRLVLSAAISAGRNRVGDTAKMLLPVKENNIRFEFAGISYRSAGKIRYRYRLIGLDSAWKETQDGYLAYPTLPSGQYTFQIQAVNRFGESSEVRNASFVVATPFWQTIWFEALVVIVFLLLVWLGVSRRIRQIRRRQDQQDRLVREKAELENRALQAQMNPHFIFNCLNSIQQFIFDGDELAVNNYISGFARLIRATLHNSSRPFISVTDEINYLSTYLSLEKMRFKDKMEYFVEVDPAIDQEKSLLPPMLIQPYAENCMRHGLRHMESGGKGYILITMQREEGRLIIVVEDNGIGRKKAMEYKSREHIEYQSKGMSMTAARIRIISAVYGGDITVKVEDVMNGEGKPAGTRVLISLPEFRHWTAEQV